MAELVTSMVIGPLVSMVKEKASSYLLEQYKVMDGMEGQREILERKLPAILDVINDAEEKGTYRPGVSAWLKALKKVAYQANDVFDEFRYEALRREAKKKGHYSMLGMDVVSLFPSHNPIVFRYKMGKKLRRIVQTVDVLVMEMNTFGFTHQKKELPSRQWRQMDSVMAGYDKDIVSNSRDKEKRKIMNILINQDSKRDLIVLPVVGMGGLGKTTFAQLIFNDPEIEKYFELRRWYCVSDDFDVGSIASNICRSNKKDCEQALLDLREEVSGKRYFIVLDDVWNRDVDKWEKLRTCLLHGGKGSAILTTTRDAEVARIMIMGVSEPHILEALDKEFLTQIFSRRAFSFHNQNRSELVSLVDEVVHRCSGSPLAAKALGSMLSNKTSLQEWKAVLTKSSICNQKTGILPILKLSYDDLPSLMKQCFSFCAVFPKDYAIEVEKLIQLWMANDFIPLEEDVLPETLGQQIFTELTWRSFFQDVKQIIPYNNEKREKLRYKTICNIHDLMHDIAISVMGKECITVMDRSNQKKLLSHPTLHLFASCDGTGPILDNFLKKQSPTLRTLLYDYDMEGSIPKLSAHSSFRALHFFAWKKSPVRPRYLKHLRYLNLSANPILTELPEEISILYNLQTLDLSYCKNLGRLPKDMKYMSSLRHLYTNGCKSLKFMPPEFGRLTSLQTLTYFVVGSGSGCSTVGELQNLNLDGELQLHGLENVTEPHAKAAGLRNKEKLTHLSLGWNSGHKELNGHLKVLDALKPHNCLQMLRIVSYKSTGLPKWMTDLSMLQHLIELHLIDCTMCEEFPQFCNFKSIRVLRLIKLDKLQSLCSVMSYPTFPSLKELQLHDLEGLNRWVMTEVTRREGPIFPLLEKIDIKNCPKLITLPEAPELKFLKVEEDKAQLSLSIVRSKYMSSLSNLDLAVVKNEVAQLHKNDEDSKIWPVWTEKQCCVHLTEMKLSGCNFFFPSIQLQETIGIWKRFEQLVFLKIRSCSLLIYWPEEEFLNLVSLKRLHIDDCNQLTCRAQVKRGAKPARDHLLPHLTALTVCSCKSVTELFSLPASLEYIDIINCPILESIWGRKDTELDSVHAEQPDTFMLMEHGNDLASTSVSVPEQLTYSRNHPLPCLKRLIIDSCDKLVNLVNLPPSLESLRILECQELSFISGQLDALADLRIVCCDKLESLGFIVGDLSSLEILVLSQCKRLASLPSDFGSCSALRSLRIEYCPAINTKLIYQHLQQRFDDLEECNLSHASSRDPLEGPTLRNPKTWKYVIPGCRPK
uniref:Uncharacterized protein n=1 Tax=Oryza barthii TaxID=65489 RepID=A0A0D3HAU9_9ORYZ